MCKISLTQVILLFYFNLGQGRDYRFKRSWLQIKSISIILPIGIAVPFSITINCS